LGVPPVSRSVEAVWPRLVEKSRLPAAYTFKSLLQQVVFHTGPLIVAGLSLAQGPAIGTGWFVAVAPKIARTPRTRRATGALRVPTIRVLVAETLLQSVAFGAIPVGLAALALENHTVALVAIGVALAVAGLFLTPIAAVAGLLVDHVGRRTRWRRFRSPSRSALYSPHWQLRT
jgi:hypothetical protein